MYCQEAYNLEGKDDTHAQIMMTQGFHDAMRDTQRTWETSEKTKCLLWVRN